MAVLSKADFAPEPKAICNLYTNSKREGKGRTGEPATISVSIASDENAKCDITVGLQSPKLPLNLGAYGHGERFVFSVGAERSYTPPASVCTSGRLKDAAVSKRIHRDVFRSNRMATIRNSVFAEGT